MMTTTKDDIRVAVSTVIFSLRRPESTTLQSCGRDQAQDRPSIVMPLVRRTREPFADRWVLPGGWLGPSEDLEAAASRTLAETTGLVPSYLEQLYAFGAVDRSPSRVVSIVYWALLRQDEAATQFSAPDAENTAWFEASSRPALAFDHDRIVDYALWRLRNKVGYSRIAHGLLPSRFTLADLREVYEGILGRTLDPANFRRQVEGSDTVIPTDEFRTGSHRPARLYRYNRDVELADRGPVTT